MTLTTLVLDGIGSSEGRNSPIVTTIAQHLETRAGTTTHYVNWRAGMIGAGAGGSWNANSRDAVTMIRRWLDTNTGDVILIAHSGGNKPVHDFLDNYPEYHHRVRAVGLVADPWRPHDRWQHGVANPGGWGVAGERYTPIPDRVFWTAVPGDFIPCAPPDSLLRHVTDVSYGHPDQLVRDAINAFQKGRFQLAAFLGLPLHEWVFGLGRRIREASDGVWRYLNGWHGQHYLGPVDTGGDERSLAVRLADSIVWAIR